MAKASNTPVVVEDAPVATAVEPTVATLVEAAPAPEAPVVSHASVAGTAPGVPVVETKSVEDVNGITVTHR